MNREEISKELLPNDHLAEVKTPQPTDTQDFEYKEFGAEPKIVLSKLSLIILSPILVLTYIVVAKIFGIPMIQYAFVTFLVAFIANYAGVVRRFELMPYLPVESFDNRLKILCVLSLAGLILSMYFGWNGSGGMIFAIYWELTRGLKIGIYGMFFGAIIIGSLLLEKNYSQSKLWELLPGLLLGYVNAELFKLKDSNPYSIAHQFIFLCSIGFPIFFPASKLIVPSLLQWIIMIACGFLLLVCVVVTIRLMQTVRVSVSVGVISGLLIAGTSVYTSKLDYVGVLLVGGGVVMLLKK